MADDRLDGAGAEDATGPEVRIYEHNPLYWTGDGDPTLLLGRSPTESLYQHVTNPEVDVEGALDRLVASGGNYLRHTMQSRDNDDHEAGFVVQPLASEDGVYDLETWNDEYWERLDTVLEWTAERGSVVQLSFWDRVDFADHVNDTWSGYSAWDPTNTVIYDADEVGLPTAGEKHPSRRCSRSFSPSRRATTAC